jgi:hypothetical protein
VWKLERAGGSREMAGEFRRFSSIARSLTRKSSVAVSHFSTFFEFSHSPQNFCTKIRALNQTGISRAKMRWEMTGSSEPLSSACYSA